MVNSSRSLASRAIGAGAWTIGTRLSSKVLDLVLLLCLARLLGPPEFGLVAVAMAVVFVVEALFELPMAAALIRVPALDRPMLNTAFTLGLIRGGAIALVLLILAVPLAELNDDPRVGPLLAVLGVAPILRGLTSPRMVEYARRFDFRPDALMELTGKILAAAASLTVALLTRSYWAIAAATVTAPFVATVASYALAPFLPRLTLKEWSRFSHLIGWNFASQLCSALNWQIDRLILPSIVPIGAFGQYTVAKQISEIPSQALIAPLQRPAMAAMAAPGSDIQARYLQLSRAIALVMVPVMAVLMLWPHALVRIALGPAWDETARWLPMLSVALIVGLPAAALSALAMTLDRTHLLALRAASELALKLPLVWIAATYFGIAGAIVGSSAATIVGTVVGLFLVRRLVGASVAAQLLTLAEPLLALLPAAFILWASADFVASAPNLLILIARAAPIGFCFAFAYGVAVLLAWHVKGCPPGLESRAWRRLTEWCRTARLIKNEELQSATRVRKAVVINGKFLMQTAPRSGVYRVALEMLLALDRALDSDPILRQAVRCQVFVPGRVSPSISLRHIELVTSTAYSGVLKALPWEQIALPWRTRGRTLVNLCNLGPVFSGDSITMIHDAQVHSSPQSYSRPFRLWYKLIQTPMARRNRVVLTVSNYSRSELARYRVCQEAKIQVIHNGCDHVLKLKADAAAAATVQLDCGAYVLALANTQAHKNIGVLLSAFGRPELQQLTLALFGSATRADFIELGHDVPPNVRFLGRITDEQLAGLLKDAVALAFPSLTEGFGLPPLEAMALGCPVIVAPRGALPEVCANAALYADPYAQGQWAQQILRICSDMDFAEELRIRGLAHAQEFTWERASRQLIDAVYGGAPLSHAASSETTAVQPSTDDVQQPPTYPTPSAN